MTGAPWYSLASRSIPEGLHHILYLDLGCSLGLIEIGNHLPRDTWESGSQGTQDMYFYVTTQQGSG